MGDEKTESCNSRGREYMYHQYLTTVGTRARLACLMRELPESPRYTNICTSTQVITPKHFTLLLHPESDYYVVTDFSSTGKPPYF